MYLVGGIGAGCLDQWSSARWAYYALRRKLFDKEKSVGYEPLSHGKPFPSWERHGDAKEDLPRTFQNHPSYLFFPCHVRNANVAN